MAKRGKNMPAPKGGGYSGGALPDPESGGGEFNDFLKPQHIGNKVGAKAKLILTGKNRHAQDSGYGEGLNLEVKLGKQLYDFTVKFSSGNYRILFARFGKNPAKWKGTINVTVDVYLKNKYIKVVD